MKNFLQQGLLLVSVLAVAACGGGGSGGGSKPVSTNSSAPSAVSSVAVVVASSSLAASSVQASSVATRSDGEITQTYSVTVDVPSSFLALAAEAATTTLTESHFAVIAVDLAGTILANIPLYADEVVLNADGSWSVSVPASPRVDYLIVVDINKPIALTLGGNIRQEDLVYAPITGENLDIDLGSTSAYNNLLEELGGTGSFTSQNFDPTNSANIRWVEQTLNGIQEIIAAQTLSQFSSVTSALAAVDTQVANIVLQQVINDNNPASGTAASLIRDEGGMYTYLAYDYGAGLNINYDALIGTLDLASYHYNGSTFVAAEPLVFAQDLLLSSSGWVLPGNGTRAISFNDDGSVAAEWVAAEGIAIKLEAEQVFALAGRNIRDFLQTDVDTQGLASVVNPASTFASDAKGYRIKSSFTETVYSLPLDVAADTEGVCASGNQNDGLLAADLGGNCNAVEVWGANQHYLGNATSLTQVFSADLAPETEGFTAISYWQSVVVQLLNDAGKTARFYQQTDITLDSDAVQTILIGTGTWAPLTLPYLTEDAAAIQVQMTTPLDVDYLPPDLSLLLVKQGGFIRVAQGFTDLSSVENSFNGAANTSIVNALTGGAPVAPSPVPTAIRTKLGYAKSLP